MAKENKRRPKRGWRQMEFRTFICSPTPKCISVFFFVAFIFSLILTSVILSFSYEIFELTAPIKSDAAVFNLTRNDLSNIKSDLFIYLEYLDYFQNHRIYLKSKSIYQLRGKYDSSLSTYCEPLTYQSDLTSDLKDYIKTFDSGNQINPCGTMPASYINTTVSAFINDKQIQIDDSEIAWPTDDERRYKVQQNQYLNINDQHFKVWMRSSPTKTLKKLYGKVSKGSLSDGTLKIAISQGVNMLSYSPSMNIKISTTTRIGGKNMVLGWTFFVICVMSLIWAVTFALIAKMNRLPLFTEVIEMRKKDRL